MSDTLDQIHDLVHRLEHAGSDLGSELELRDLRFAAAAEVDSQGSGTWPPAYDDPFPDVTGRLPEIRPDSATAEVVGGAVLHHGAVIVRGMLDHGDVERIRTGMDRVFAARQAVEAAASGGPEPSEEDLAWYCPFRPGRNTAGQKGKPHLIRLVDSPRLMADVLGTYRRLGILPMVADHFGEAPVFTANKTVLRYLEVPDTILPSDFHQDGRFMGEDIRALNVWVTLTDCGTDAPTLDLVPRREPCVHPTGQGVNGFDWTLAETQVRELAGDAGIIRLELEAGDGVIFDQLLVHRSAFSREMTQMRQAIESWFYAPSTVPASYQGLLA